MSHSANGLIQGQQRGDAQSLTGAKVLAALILFFGVIFSVNGMLAYYAISTFRGEVADHPYEAGLAFNREIAAARAQQARNWRVDIAFPRGVGGKRIEVSARDTEGRAIGGLKLTAAFRAPVDASRDRLVEMYEQRPGIYTTEAPVAGGRWDIEIAARRDGETLFQSKSRVLIE